VIRPAPCGRSQPRGFTLLELTVTAGLTLLVLVMAARFFWPLVRTVIRSQERAGLQQRATLAMESLRSALQSTNPGGLAYQPGRLAIHPLDTRSAASRPRYLLELWSFTWSEQKLRRQRWSPSPFPLADDAPTRLTPAQLALFPAVCPDERLLATGVSEFTLTSDAPLPQLANPVRLRLVVANEQDRFEWQETVLLRNSV